MNENLKLYRSDWIDLHEDSLNFIKAILKKNPKRRLTPGEALEHPFIAHPKSKKKIKPSLLEKLAKNESEGLLKKEIFMILSTYIKTDVIVKWDKIFNRLDSEGNGEIRIVEVIEKLKETNISQSRMKKIEKELKGNIDAKISYSDFLNKVINVKKEIKEEDINKGNFNSLSLQFSSAILMPYIPC